MASSLFDDLTVGCDFDTKRFRKDAIRLGLISGAPDDQAIVNPTKPTKKLKIYTSGTDIPAPAASLPEWVKIAGIVDPTPVQTQAIPVMEARRNCLVCAPTGSGKTLAFLLPTISRQRALKAQRSKARVLILQPSKELAMQTKREFDRVNPPGSGIQAHCLMNISEKVQKHLKNNPPNIILTTPNKLIHYLQSDNAGITELFHKLLSEIDTLIVDEADKLFEDSHKTDTQRSFRTQLGSIFTKLSKNKHRVVYGFFSATYLADVEEWCQSNLDSPISVGVGTKNTANTKIDQSLVFTTDESGKLLAIRNLLRAGFEPPALVFVQSKDRAKDLYHELEYDQFRVASIHGDMNDQVRDAIVRDFREGKYWVLICTELMGRGIDFLGVGLVVNYDLPTSAISYIHRIGRTGRAGRTGKAVTFFTKIDKERLRTIAGVMKQAGCEVPEYIMTMPKLNSKNRKKLAKSQPTRDEIRKKFTKKRKIEDADKTASVPEKPKKSPKSAEIVKKPPSKNPASKKQNNHKKLKRKRCDALLDKT